MRAVSLIEPLEDRIAPAAVTISPNGKTASYQDSFGDTIKVTTTKGTFETSQFTLVSGQLTELSLTGNKAFNGANIAFSITPVSQGVSTVDVGYIDAINLHLGSVAIPGDLSRIDAGGSSSPTALGKLTVNSLGAVANTQFGTESSITGSINKISIAGNLDGALNVQDYNGKAGTGNIQQLNIGGSLDGNTSSGAGVIFFTGKLGTAVINGGIEGGSGEEYGSIEGSLGTLSKIGSITVKGSVPDDPNPSPGPSIPGTSIAGGSGALSGGIIAATINSVNIAGSVTGGTGTASGFIEAGLTLGKVTIGGSLSGGNFTPGNRSQANSSGLVFGGTSIASVTIGQSIYGGSGLSSGEVLSNGTIEKATIMGNVVGGSAGSSSSNGLAGTISANVLGTVIVDGSLVGGTLVSGDANQVASYCGLISGTTKIGSLKIGHDLTGGSGASAGEITTGSGGLGKLTIGGNVTGGSADNTGLIAVIGGVLKSATIGGNIVGSSSAAMQLSDTGYVQAAGIGTMTVGGALISGTAGSGGLDISGSIRSTTTIGNLTVGSIVGNSSYPAVISAVGKASVAANATSDVAISSITVKDGSTYGDILAGYNIDTQNGAQPLGTGVNADAQIGTVNIGGNFTATSIVAGVAPGSSGFGTSGSTLLSGSGVTDLPSIISKISKIVIGGSVTAPNPATADTFGIAAQWIVAAKVDGVTVPLVAGADNDTFAAKADHPLGGAGANVVLYEV